jgi:RNA polymerase-binding transcription factor DksA
VNKAGDYYTSAAELAQPELAKSRNQSAADVHQNENDNTLPRQQKRSSKSTAKGPRHETTVARLSRAERALDEAIDAAYERFARCEITGAEFDRERRRLTESFNDLVRSENIRYRSLVRQL